jgi:hypothetical protein
VIVIIDFFVFNRRRADVPALYASPETSRYGDIRWRSLVALAIGLVAGWAFEYGGASLFQGPIARATDGVDFSWLASIVFGGLTYFLLCRSEPILSPRLRWPPRMLARSWPLRSVSHETPVSRAGEGAQCVRPFLKADAQSAVVEVE